MNGEGKNNSIKEPKPHKKALLFDKAAKVVIYFGGIATILSVVAILVFVLWEALPLWFGAKGNTKDKFNAKEVLQTKIPLLIGVDEYQEILYTFTDSATVDFISLASKKLISSSKVDSTSNEVITSSSKSPFRNLIAVGTNKGNVILGQVKFSVMFVEEDQRKITPEFMLISKMKIDSLQKPIRKIVYRKNSENEYTVIALTADNRLIQYSSEKSTSLFSEPEEKVYHNDLTSIIEYPISAIELDNFCEKLMIGTSNGWLYYISLKDKTNPQLIQKINPTPSGKSAITSLGFIIGDQSLIVGDADGNVTSWMRVLDEKTDYGWKLVNSHTFDSHRAAVTSIATSLRNKSFITGDSKGKIFLEHLTSERTLLELSGKELPVKDIAFSPKGDGAVVLYNDGTIVSFDIRNPHPEITLKTLFGKVWYEGYTKPEYVWQSTGGTDDFEPKFSLIPLIIGTLKGTFYAMLFAIPLALFGALYTSQFSHPKIRNYIKPTVEVMAALPSVVIGFLAGLWLAPLLERILPGVFLMFIIVPIVIVIGASIWKRIPSRIRYKLKPGYELIFIIPLIILAFYIAQWLGPIFEYYFLGGDYRTWLMSTLNEQYDQRNSIVVGFAMGFAVIPIIFTICEDALSSVPASLTSASLALGATRWETATRIVLPSASPGIFSAIMIGFGRAVGETMIVLMATGNTPILSFSPFNGMRTLSANIAVEIPEAPYQGTLYRVLFLAATLLFIFTFIVNTVAEIVRQRLRKKYAQL
ncbi:MAG: ABC transporter permease subunit [Ignavibacterium sp.]|uniref:ABC transporter permease subunit n=1 Tax=Ignavibacterium sp. TaxID=2651167 RepID=UPI00404904C6